MPEARWLLIGRTDVGMATELPSICQNNQPLGKLHLGSFSAMFNDGERDRITPQMATTLERSFWGT